MKQQNYKKLLLWLFFFAIVSALPFVLTNDYNRHVMILSLFYAIMGSAWNLLGGYAGQVSFGNAVYFGIGAYTSAVMVTKLNLSPWIGMFFGMGIAVLIAVLIGIPFFRLKDHYFVIATIALLLIVQALATKWEFVGGAVGLSIPIQKDSFWMMQFKSKIPFYYILVVFLLITVVIIYKIISSKTGYYLRTIKLNQDAAESLGVNSRRYKLYALIVCAAITSAAGTIYSQYFLYLDPASIITQDISLLMVLVSVFGGVETVAGPVLGAAVLVPLAEYSRAKLGGTGSGIDQMIYGVMVLLMALYQPKGMIMIFRKIKAKVLREGGGSIARTNS